MKKKKKKFLCGPDIPFIDSDMLITYTGKGNLEELFCILF